MQLSSQLQQLRCLVYSLGWGVSHRLPPFLRRGYVLSDDLLGHEVDHWPAVDEGVGVKGAILQALLDHLSDGGLRKGPVVDLLRLLGR